jgi:hypothetical protein
MARLVLLLFVATCVRPVVAQDVALEYRVKAAYLYNFVKFVEWPDASEKGPVNICVAGHNPFGHVLADTVRGESVDGRPLTARVILEPEAGCDVLFIPDGAAASVYLKAARGMPTLTVSCNRAGSSSSSTTAITSGSPSAWTPPTKRNCR